MGPLTAPAVTTVRGVPRDLDAPLRFPARLLLHTLGAVGTLALAWFGAWWWVPWPLAGSFLLYEWLFWSRTDQPIALTLGPDEVVIRDAFLASTRRVPLASLHAASLSWRPLDRDRVEVMLVLADRDEIVLGVHLRLPVEAFRAHPDDVAVEAANAVLGSIGGLPRAMCPREALVRQPVADPRVLDWFRALPDAARSRRAVRFWRGRSPPLDLFAYHSGPPDGLLVLDGPRASVGPGAEPRPLDAGPPEAGSRALVAFRRPGDAGPGSDRTVPLWIQPAAGARFAIPAPLADGLPAVEADDTLLHLHAGDGATLLWHLWRNTPVERWPDAWNEALTAARPTLEVWPEGLAIPTPAPAASVTLPPPPGEPP